MPLQLCDNAVRKDLQKLRIIRRKCLGLLSMMQIDPTLWPEPRTSGAPA